MGVGMVGLKRLAGHASVKVVSHFEHIPVDRNISHSVVKVSRNSTEGSHSLRNGATYEENEVVSLDRFLLESTGF